MLEIRKGTAAKNYENTFFREFAENLKNLFDKYSLDGLLIANSECEAEKRLQIDALLITEKAVCIIDFKNFGGKITLPKNAKSEFDFGKWTNEKGEIIKGGSSINPFIQLKNQKDRFIKVVENQIIDRLPMSDCFNPYHTVRTVCFQKAIELIGSIPPKDELNFFIIDKSNYLEKIKDIIDITDKEVSLTKKSYDVFKEVFRADIFDLSENYGETTDFTTYETELDFENLYPDQKSALQEIESFIKSQEDRFFVLQGTSLSGKTHLIPFIQDVAYNNHIPEAKLFASSGRVANNLLKNTNLEFNSIYSYIYGGNITNSETEEKQETENQDEDKIDLEVVPLKKSDDTEEAIFIVDESHLISDNYHQSIDLRFGSGKLLKDFIEFADLKNSKRKIIFVGDSFQLSIGKKEESALNPEYLSDEYNFEAKAFQLVDKEKKSPIVAEALKAVNGIRHQLFNNFLLNQNDELTILEKNNVLPIIQNSVLNENNFCWITFSREKALDINLRIKEKILKNGKDISINDYLIFENNIKIFIDNDFYAERKKVYNGEFARVLKLSDTITKSQGLLTPLYFQPIHVSVFGSNIEYEILSFENYRNSRKGELSKDEIISFKILLNQLAEEELINFENGKYHSDDELNLLLKQQKEGKRVKTKIRSRLRKLLNDYPNTNYYRFKNAATLRYGWALTVHKSMSYKWNEVFFDLEPGAGLSGITNEQYYRFTYTGMIRANSKLNLINFNPITPFYKIGNDDIKDHNKGIAPDDRILFKANIEDEIQNKDLPIVEKYRFDEANASQLLQIFHFITSKLRDNEWIIKDITHNKNQETYEIKKSNNICKISIYYRDNGRVNLPTVMKSEPKSFGDEVTEILTSPLSAETNLSFINDSWRQLAYQKIINELEALGLSVNYIVQSNKLDTLKVSSETSKLIVLVDYELDGFFTGFRANYYSDDIIWSKFKNAINKIRKCNGINV